MIIIPAPHRTPIAHMNTAEPEVYSVFVNKVTAACQDLPSRGSQVKRSVVKLLRLRVQSACCDQRVSRFSHPFQLIPKLRVAQPVNRLNLPEPWKQRFEFGGAARNQLERSVLYSTKAIQHGRKSRKLKQQRISQKRHCRCVSLKKTQDIARVRRAVSFPGLFSNAEFFLSHLVPVIKQRSQLLAGQLTEPPEVFDTGKHADANEAQFVLVARLVREPIKQVDQVNLAKQIVFEPQYSLTVLRAVLERGFLLQQVHPAIFGVQVVSVA